MNYYEFLEEIHASFLAISTVLKLEILTARLASTLETYNCCAFYFKSRPVDLTPKQCSILVIMTWADQKINPWYESFMIYIDTLGHCLRCATPSFDRPALYSPLISEKDLNHRQGVYIPICSTVFFGCGPPGTTVAAYRGSLTLSLVISS